MAEILLSILVAVSLCASSLPAAEAKVSKSESLPLNDPETPMPSPLAKPEDRDRQTMDGVSLHAVENMFFPGANELDLGMGLSPFNAYYTAIGIYGGYNYYFSEDLGWEILHGGYTLDVQNSLLQYLAATYNATISSFESLNFFFSSNLVWIHSYGKFVFLRNFIRYFKSALIIGPAVVNTSKSTYLSVDGGIRFDMYFSDRMLVRFEIRDYLTLNGLNSFIFFNLGTGFFL